MYVTDVAGLHSGRQPGLGHVLGRRHRPPDRRAASSPRPPTSSRSPPTSSMLKAVAAAGADARWVPFGGSVKTPAVLIAEMAVGGA